ncbi:MAG: hypothetical protein DRQ89_15135 [Epsilonproteobacteria bacterium]|nr:MAG: hypothetical protein DRQ89_15135 [Campylobacterota bacterium]
MSNCTGIFQGSNFDCQDPLTVGIVQRVLIANRQDVKEILYSIVEGEENVIESIEMQPDKTFFEFGGVNESIRVQNELLRRSLSNGYKHQLDFIVNEVDNLSLQNMMAMAYQKQVAIVYGENESSFGNGAFQMLGVDSGLDLITNVRINGDVESGGAHQLQLASPDTGGDEKIIPPVIWSTDYGTTLAMIEALLSPPIP